MKNIKKVFLESSFSKVFNTIKQNPHKYLYTLVLDFIFLALIVLIGKALGSLIPQDPQQIMGLLKAKSNLVLFSLIYIALYYLLIIFIYSIAKLSILNIIKSLYEKNKLNLKRLGKFYSLNISIFALFFFAALIILGILTLTLERDFIKYIVLILLIPFLFFLYSIINISHILFIQGTRKGIIKKSFDIAFNKIDRYGMFVVWNIILTLLYSLLYNIISFFFKAFIFTNQEMLTSYGDIYSKIINIISIIFIYLVISFNRIYFYERLKNVLQ